MTRFLLGSFHEIIQILPGDHSEPPVDSNQRILILNEGSGNLASYDFEAFSRRVCPQEPERTAGLRYSLSDSSEIWVGAAALLPSTIFNRVTYPTTRFLSRLVFASTRSARTVLLDS